MIMFIVHDRLLETNVFSSVCQSPALAWVVVKVAAFPGVWSGTLRPLVLSAGLSLLLFLDNSMSSGGLLDKKTNIRVVVSLDYILLLLLLKTCELDFCIHYSFEHWKIPIFDTKIPVTRGVIIWLLKSYYMLTGHQKGNLGLVFAIQKKMLDSCYCLRL